MSQLSLSLCKLIYDDHIHRHADYKLKIVIELQCCALRNEHY